MKSKFLMMALMMVALATVAHAQTGTAESGCGSSPENPTAILALVGSAGGFLASARSRWFRK